MSAVPLTAAARVAVGVTSLTGQFRPSRPLSAAREIVVKCSRQLPTGRAEVLSINGSVVANGGRASRNSNQMRAERSRYHQHMPVRGNIMNRRIALRLIGAVAAAALLAFDSAATSLAQVL
jgi:hypothetical protein